MPVNWNEEMHWAKETKRKAKELGCSIEEGVAVLGSLQCFVGAPARITKLATHCLEHMTQLSEEIERDIKASEKN